MPQGGCIWPVRWMRGWGGGGPQGQEVGRRCGWICTPAVGSSSSSTSVGESQQAVSGTSPCLSVGVERVLELVFVLVGGQLADFEWKRLWPHWHSSHIKSSNIQIGIIGSATARRDASLRLCWHVQWWWRLPLVPCLRGGRRVTHGFSTPRLHSRRPEGVTYQYIIVAAAADRPARGREVPASMAKGDAPLLHKARAKFSLHLHPSRAGDIVEGARDELDSRLLRWGGGGSVCGGYPRARALVGGAQDRGS